MYVVVLITASTQEEAEKIVSVLIEENQVACANILPGVRSFFLWEGKKQSEEEVLIIAKSQRLKFSAIQETVKEVHSYSVPEIIALPIIEGSSEYLAWMENVLGVSPDLKKY